MDLFRCTTNTIGQSYIAQKGVLNVQKYEFSLSRRAIQNPLLASKVEKYFAPATYYVYVYSRYWIMSTTYGFIQVPWVKTETKHSVLLVKLIQRSHPYSWLCHLYDTTLYDTGLADSLNPQRHLCSQASPPGLHEHLYLN